MSRIIRNSDKIRNLHFDPIPNDISSDEDFQTGKTLAAESTAAAGVIEDSVTRASLIIEEAERRVRQIEHEAYQKGYQEGLDSARAEISKALDTIISIAKQAAEEKWRVINSVEENIVNLAVEIAEKIVCEQVTVDPRVIVNVARKALMVAAEREHIEIRVSPDDLEIMRAHKDELMSIADRIEKIEIIADRRIKRGGCILETSAGNVDARVQSQLYQVEQALRGVVSGNEAGD
ncbi:MAG: hypothetical protein K6T91_00700 [Firmicutes bacterium]|nr:hypothetical protein [Bacillota bacterium]